MWGSGEEGRREGRCIYGYDVYEGIGKGLDF